MALLNFFRSTIGLKVIMGITGFGMFAFVIGHMLGNLQFFVGAEVINAYAHLLQASKELLWGVRLGLIAMVALHIWAAVTLTIRNRQARAQAYDTGTPYKASLASRTMMISGIIIVAFIVFHILHFTTRDIFDYSGPEFVEQTAHGERFNVYNMMIAGFSKPWVAIFYVISMVLLGFHLSHGVASAFRSIGLMNESYRKIEERAAAVFAAVIVVGMSSLPITILLGFFQPISPSGEHIAEDAAKQPPAITLTHGTES